MNISEMLINFKSFMDIMDYTESWKTLQRKIFFIDIG